MPYLLPFAMLFGFLTMHVRRGDAFDVVMPLVLLAAVAWTFVAIVKSEMLKVKRGEATRVGAMLVAGFVLFTLFAQFDVVTYDALGPQFLSVPLVLVAIWTALVFGGAVIVERKEKREKEKIMTGIITLGFAMLIVAAWALVVNPALFTLGVVAYRTPGLYYGVPFAHVAFWAVSVAVGVVVMRWMSNHTSSPLPLGAIAGPLLLVGYATGVCIAVGAWVPAVLGLVVAQLGFRAMYYL